MEETQSKQKKIKCEIYHDNFQNYKKYNIPKAQLVIADIPYNLGTKFYASNPMWYNDGDNSNGESKFAKKAAFNSDFRFNIAEYFHFCHKLLKPEPKESGGVRGRSSKAGAMIIFCSFEQYSMLLEYGKKSGFNHAYPIFFIKNYSAQVLKANMKIVGATECAVVLYREKLPKFNNDGKMVFDHFDWEKDGKDIPKIHPTQKPVKVLKKLIRIFTDPGDVVIDPCCGSGTTLRAAKELGRNSYGFEIDKKFYTLAKDEMLTEKPTDQITFFEQIERMNEI